MKKVSNLEEMQKKAKHELKINSNRLLKECEEAEIPIFIAYFIPGEGYVYQGLLPEEIGTENVSSEYGRFTEFLKTCIGFNQADVKPIIKLNSSEDKAMDESEE